MPRPAMTEERSREIRSALLDTAQQLYEAGGPEAMSFRAIAQAYGCSSTMPYSYFDSKAEIIDGLRVRAYGWLQGVLAEASQGADGPLAALLALGTAYVRAHAARPRLYELLYSDAGALGERDPDLVTAKLDALRVCQRAIEAAAESGDLVLSTDPQTAAHLFWIAAHGLASLDGGGFLVVGRTAEELLPTLLATLTRGLTQEGVSP